MTRVQKLDRAVFDLAGGDKGVLSTIYDLMARTIFSAAYVVTENRQDAEDVLQDTFIEIVRYAPGFAGGSAKAWILTLARHIAVDLVRKRKNFVTYDEIAETGLLSRSDDFSRPEVLDMMNRLSEEERQIVTYRVYAKMPHREIAEVMGIPEATAQKKYRRALTKLRKDLEHEKH
jgi:RNA polymerase sigma-70 factor (ECF subfamily)